MIKNKKGQVFGQLQGLAIGIVGLTIAMVVGFLILANLGANASVAADGNSTAAVQTLTSAAATIPSWVPIVVVTVIGALLLFLVRQFSGGD